ncbi:MAG: hypothetical protein KDD38_08560, partial [Bdellovibrionales bacterium]|nr:hypothetical protein [Bdellovibrionales bacterium]
MNRRNMIKTAIGGVGTLLASTTLAADACKSFMTPAQPEGPFYPVKKIFDQDANLVRVEGRSQEAEGTKILIVGKVIDQHCRPVEGALIDLWQACHT